MALAQLVGRTDGGVVRQVIRDHVERCMLGSDYHMEFAVRALVLGACEAKFERKANRV